LALSFWGFRIIKRGDDGFGILLIVIAFVIATVWLFAYINAFIGN